MKGYDIIPYLYLYDMSRFRYGSPSDLGLMVGQICGKKRSETGDANGVYRQPSVWHEWGEGGRGDERERERERDEREANSSSKIPMGYHTMSWTSSSCRLQTYDDT